MKRSFSLLGILLAAFISAAGTFLALEVFQNESPAPGARSMTLYSTILGEDREYSVHLPEKYTSDTTRRYPVLYVLDGTSQSGHTTESAALLARIGLAPPMIVVGIPSLDSDIRNRDYTPPNMRQDIDDTASPTGAADRFLEHLEQELIPLIEQEYRTTRPRMLAGWSRGGLFTVYSQIAAPALFDGRFAHSPALWREDNLIVRQLEQFLATSSVPAGFLFFSLGDAENEKMTAALQEATAMLKRRAPTGLRWKTYTSIDGVHETNPRLSTPVGLCAMFNAQQPCTVSSFQK